MLDLRISGLQCVGQPKATTKVVRCLRKGLHPPEYSEKPCFRRLRLGKMTLLILISVHHKSLICKTVMRSLHYPRGVVLELTNVLVTLRYSSEGFHSPYCTVHESEVQLKSIFYDLIIKT